MKKQLIFLLSLCLLAALCSACGAKPAEPKDSVPSGTAVENTAPADTGAKASLPNPITAYDSLEEINEAVGGNLCHPPVMGVTEESFSVIDGESKIAQYAFTVSGVKYTYRFCADTAEDISGIYVENGTLFSGKLNETEATETFSGGIGARFCCDEGQYVLIGQAENGVDEEMFRSVSRELFSLASPQNADPDAFIGSWHDSIAGRGMMDVTTADGQLVFDVRWSDSASTYYVWTFCGLPDANGVLTYDGGFYGKVEFDENGKETKKILDEDASGTVEIAADGTMLWTEKGETHEFTKENTGLYAFLGSWHDNIAGRGMMDVSLEDGQLVFDVRWSDSASTSYVWTFCGLPDENGVLNYEGGFYGKTEFDADNKQTNTILDEDATGSVEIAEDGTMLWTENGETHEFRKEPV